MLARCEQLLRETSPVDEAANVARLRALCRVAGEMHSHGQGAAADGLLVLAVGNDGQWVRVCEAMGEPERARDERIATNPGRLAHRAEVVGWLAARFAAEPVATWVERFRRHGVPAGPVRDVLDVVRDPVLTQRGMVHTHPFPGGGETALLSLPWLVDGARAPVRRVPPALGEHTAEFLAEFGT